MLPICHQAPVLVLEIGYVTIFLFCAYNYSMRILLFFSFFAVCMASHSKQKSINLPAQLVEFAEKMKCNPQHQFGFIKGDLDGKGGEQTAFWCKPKNMHIPVRGYDLYILGKVSCSSKILDQNPGPMVIRNVHDAEGPIKLASMWKYNSKGKRIDPLSYGPKAKVTSHNIISVSVGTSLKTYYYCWEGHWLALEVD